MRDDLDIPETERALELAVVEAAGHFVGEVRKYERGEFPPGSVRQIGVVKARRALAAAVDALQTHREAAVAETERLPELCPVMVDAPIPETPYGASRGEAWREPRNWSWVGTEEFTELCKRATCEATDATHWHRLQDAHSGLSDYNAIPRPIGLDPEVHGPPLLDGSQMLAGVDSGAAKLPTGTRCHCVACEGTAAVHLTTAPACPDCPRILPALRRWLNARDATTGMVPADLPVDQVIAVCDEANAANDALVALAREVAP